FPKRHQRFPYHQFFHPSFKTSFFFKLGQLSKDLHKTFDHHVLGQVTVFDISQADGQKSPTVLAIKVLLGFSVPANTAFYNLCLCGTTFPDKHSYLLSISRCKVVKNGCMRWKSNWGFNCALDFYILLRWIGRFCHSPV